MLSIRFMRALFKQYLGVGKNKVLYQYFTCEHFNLDAVCVGTNFYQAPKEICSCRYSTQPLRFYIVSSCDKWSSRCYASLLLLSCQVRRCSTSNLTMCNRASDDPQNGLYCTSATLDVCHASITAGNIGMQTNLVSCVSAIINPGKEDSKGSLCQQDYPCSLLPACPPLVDSSNRGRMKTSGRGSLILTPVFSGNVIWSYTWACECDWGTKTLREMIAGNKPLPTGQSILMPVLRSLKGKLAS